MSTRSKKKNTVAPSYVVTQTKTCGFVNSKCSFRIFIEDTYLLCQVDNFMSRFDLCFSENQLFCSLILLITTRWYCLHLVTVRPTMYLSFFTEFSFSVPREKETEREWRVKFTCQVITNTYKCNTSHVTTFV